VTSIRVWLKVYHIQFWLTNFLQVFLSGLIHTHDFLCKSISSIAKGIGRDYLEWENLFASGLQQFDNDSPSIAMYS
jgi:hypothetical protein